jgi:arylsulfatase A-like enzyme
MHIPLLILHPGDPAFPRGTRIDAVGSQTAIAPTVLQLLGVSARHSFAANSLLAPAPGRFGMFAWGGMAGWINDEELLVHDLQRPVALYRWREDPALKRDLLAAPEARATVRDFEAYLQTVSSLLVGNRVAPRAP